MPTRRNFLAAASALVAFPLLGKSVFARPVQTLPDTQGLGEASFGMQSIISAARKIGTGMILVRSLRQNDMACEAFARTLSARANVPPDLLYLDLANYVESTRGRRNEAPWESTYLCVQSILAQARRRETTTVLCLYGREMVGGECRYPGGKIALFSAHLGIDLYRYRGSLMANVWKNRQGKKFVANVTSGQS